MRSEVIYFSKLIYDQIIESLLNLVLSVQYAMEAILSQQEYTGNANGKVILGYLGKSQPSK